MLYLLVLITTIKKQIMKKIDVKAIIAAFFILCTISLSASNPWTKMSNFTGAARDYGTSFTIGHYGFIGCGFNGEVAE
jgi:hypothetical protein